MDNSTNQDQSPVQPVQKGVTAIKPPFDPLGIFHYPLQEQQDMVLNHQRAKDLLNGLSGEFSSSFLKSNRDSASLDQ